MINKKVNSNMIYIKIDDILDDIKFIKFIDQFEKHYKVNIIFEKSPDSNFYSVKMKNPQTKTSITRIFWLSMFESFDSAVNMITTELMGLYLDLKGVEMA